MTSVTSAKDSLLAGLTTVITFVPKLLAFLVILIIGLMIAKTISKAVGKILQHVGFDKAVERGGIKKALAKSEYDAATIVGKIIYYALMLFVLQLAFGVFGPNPISELLTRIIAFIPALIVAIIIIVVAAAIAAAVKTLIRAPWVACPTARHWPTSPACSSCSWVWSPRSTRSASPRRSPPRC